LIILWDTDGIRRSYFRKAIEDCGTDFELGELAVEGTRSDTLAEQLEAVHLGFDQTAAMIAAPLLPDCPPQIFRRRSVSLRASTPGPSLVHILPLRRTGMIGSAPRSAMADFYSAVDSNQAS